MSAQKKSVKKTPAAKPKRQSSAGKEEAASPKVDEESCIKSGSGKPGGGNLANEMHSATPGKDQSDGLSDYGTTDGSAEEVDGVLKPATQITDPHFKVVELATQLACAQLAAEASMESARVTVEGIHQIAMVFVDREYAKFNKVWKIPGVPFHKASPLNHPDHDALFEGAVIRAQRLLRSPSEDTSLVHAEQLFDAEEILSEAQVGERFKECGWPGLSNRGDFYETIVAVENWFYDHLGRLHFPEEDNQFSEDAEMMGYVLDLGRRRQENDLFRRIYELVRGIEPQNQPRGVWTSTDELSHAIWTQHVIDVIFCRRQPSKTRSEERRTTRRYRPWGLFRFLRLHGADDPVGGNLLEQLVTRRNQLKADAIIYPFSQSYPQSYDFGPLDRLVNAKEQGL